MAMVKNQHGTPRAIALIIGFLLFCAMLNPPAYGANVVAVDQQVRGERMVFIEPVNVQLMVLTENCGSHGFTATPHHPTEGPASGASDGFVIRSFNNRRR